MALPPGEAKRDVVGIVVAAGRGERLGGGVPKQFLDLAGGTLLERAIGALTSNPATRGVVVVLHPEEIGGDRARAVARLPGVLRVVAGGDARAASVTRGVEAALPCGHVLVHDAARPLASPALVDRVVVATLRAGAAVPVVPIADTVKEDDGSGGVARTVDRARLRLAQTPQGAVASWLLDALHAAAAAGIAVTDEAHALELAGREVALVEGEPGNVKITTAEDLAQARRRLEDRAAGLRVGIGFDVHRLADGRRLVLGGVEFPGERGLSGHSDADVVLHAAMDAALGAAGLGDIGEHFPPGDPRFEGADSAVLARRVAGLLAEAGFELVNLDLTLLAERPRVRERVPEMRAAVARAFLVEPARVSVKATTLEGLGPLGRSEGIACQASALLRRTGGRV